MHVLGVPDTLCRIHMLIMDFGHRIQEWIIYIHHYNIISEIMDFGYPQNLSPEILKLYITQEGVRSPFSSKVGILLLKLIQTWFSKVFPE